MADKEPRMRLTDRTGAEVVMLLLAIAMSSVLLITTIGLLIFKLLYPQETFDIPSGLYDLMKVVLSGLIGYVAGRGLGKVGGKREGDNDSRPTA